MEVNLGNNIGGNISARNDTAGASVNNVGGKTSDSSRLSISSNLTIGKGVDALASAEPTADVPESELVRDDALGKLVNAAFVFQAPPMPSFAD